jgi:hypothetical protein
MVLESFVILLLAHLIADFPLQTDLIFRLKRQSQWGVALHASIHGMVTFLLTGFRWDLIHVWLVLTFAHYLIDTAKLKYNPPQQAAGFLIDQLAHVSVVLIIAIWQPGLTSILPDWVLYAAFIYAWIPATLMYIWVVAAEKAQKQAHPAERVSWMREHLLRWSQLAGIPLALVLLVTPFLN